MGIHNDKVLLKEKINEIKQFEKDLQKIKSYFQISENQQNMSLQEFYETVNILDEDININNLNKKNNDSQSLRQLAIIINELKNQLEEKVQEENVDLDLNKINEFKDWIKKHKGE
ncbi:hypothetical protein FJO69_01860 [[Mycoplasma] falconis]|uniref:Uncharacterized protein n=1 Tax=[Mycoplasma] falconis TaxID=92403 RepID=A0A501XAG9_9BACT|nr:hypothetical protein [[Mycoplasma] falconis]TPE57353.1 hypothetical protein FJO69_01860 [[Mycoplasma] falconis]